MVSKGASFSRPNRTSADTWRLLLALAATFDLEVTECSESVEPIQEVIYQYNEKLLMKMGSHILYGLTCAENNVKQYNTKCVGNVILLLI